MKIKESTFPYSSILYLFIFSTTANALSLSAYAQEEKKEWRCATVAPKGTEFEKIFNENLKKIKSIDPSIKIISYLGPSYGDEIDIGKAIRSGELDCAVLTNNGLGYILPFFRILDFPFLFKSIDEFRKIKAKIVPMFAKLADESGYKFFNFLEIGEVFLISKSPIKSTKDLKDKTFWVWNTNIIQIATFDIFRNFGMKEIRIGLFDVERLIDSLDVIWAPPYALVAYGWFKKYKYIIKPHMVIFTGGVIVRKGSFERLQTRVRNILEEELIKLHDEVSEEIDKLNENTIKTLTQKYGYSVVNFDDIQKLEEIFKENMWRALQKYVPNWLIVSVLEELAKIRSTEM